MFNNHVSFLVDTCDIERADIDVDTLTIRDRRVAKWDAIATSQKCWFEPNGTSFLHDSLMGQTAVKNFTVYFLGGVSVREGDRLKKGSVYYQVQEVQDYTSQKLHVLARVTQKNYVMV